MATSINPRKIAVHASTSDSSCTYVFVDEDHTLGNALRYVLIRNPQTAFCGYTIPHPTEPKMHMRLQTQGNSSNSVLRSGLEDLRTISEHIKSVYQKELQHFQH